MRILLEPVPLVAGELVDLVAMVAPLVLALVVAVVASLAVRLVE